MTSKHPANNNRALLTAWVDPVLRDCVRVAAKETGMPFSEWVGEALREVLANKDEAHGLAHKLRDPKFTPRERSARLTASLSSAGRKVVQHD